MKTTSLFLLALAFGALTACGGGESTDGSDSTATDGESSEPEVTYLLPSTYGGEVLPVEKLHEAVTAWDGKTVTLVGYPSLFFDTEKLRAGSNTLMTIAEKDGAEKLIRFELAEETAEITRGQMIVIQGTIEKVWDTQIQLKDTKLVEVLPADASPSYTEPNPFTVGDSQMSAEAFHKAYFGWEGKVVSVNGAYWGTTTSTTSSGKTIRVDLTPVGGGDKMVGANFKEDPSDRLSANRDNVEIKGTVQGRFFESITLEDCTVLKP